MNKKAKPTPPNLPIELRKFIINRAFPRIFIGIISVAITVATARVDPKPIPYNNLQPHSQASEILKERRTALTDCMIVPNSSAFFLPLRLDCTPESKAPSPTPT